jgi:hypothetical protein
VLGAGGCWVQVLVWSWSWFLGGGLGSWFLGGGLGSWFLAFCVLGPSFLVFLVFLVLASCFLVLGSRFLVLGSCFLVLGSVSLRKCASRHGTGVFVVVGIVPAFFLKALAFPSRCSPQAGHDP